MPKHDRVALLAQTPAEMTLGDQSAVHGGRIRMAQSDAANPHSAIVPRKPGRKPGKHSNKNYTQTSIYLPIELRNKVRARLYERGMEMSGLVEGMLRNWLAAELER